MVRRPSYRFTQNQVEYNLGDIMFQSIKQKGRALELYEKLLGQPPPDVFSTSMVSNAQSVEQRMMNRLSEQYQLLFGTPPGYTVEPMDVAFPTFTDGVVLAINYNFQVISFQRETIDMLGAEGVGFQLYFYLLLSDMSQQDLLITLYIHLLHHSGFGSL